MESLYLLWRTTGEHRWREYAWLIFESIEKHTKTDSGYASVRIEGNGAVYQVDEMQRYVIMVPLHEFLAKKKSHSSFFLAETWVAPPFLDEKMTDMNEN